MHYQQLAQAYDEIEKISGNLEKIRIFADLLKEATPSEVDCIIALTMGKLHPDWKGEPELGVAEKMAIQVVAAAASIPESSVTDTLRKTGDIGSTAEELLQESAQATLFTEDLTISMVYNTLDNVARISGSGSNKEKIAKLVSILTDAQPIEARYILRTVTGSLRLGLGDMSIIDALSLAYTGDREARSDIENAFNVCSDLRKVARVLAENGINSVKKIHTEVGVPIRMMAAKKLSDATEILEKVGKRALVEYKYDGERIQAHKNGNDITLYSRRQEIITDQYPDVVELMKNHIKAKSCVLEGECVAIDPETGKTRPFQELMRRRRKTDIKKMQEEVPIALYIFDILYLNGKDVTELPMLERRKLMEETVEINDRVNLTTAELTEDPDRLYEIFKDAIGSGYEGVIAKAVHKDSKYQAGARSWLWIKLKASYTEGLADSADLVIVGALYGRGKRTGLYGAILASAYDDMTDTYPTVCKIGTGFTEDMLAEFKERLEEHIVEIKNPKVISDIEADVWFEPVEVIEVLGDEITVSPTHPAGRNRMKVEGGLAIRFPRFTGKWRDDKNPTQATTVDDLIEAFERQRGINQ
ncbi:MAG: ATP-dependent DNA ligase [Candidatus Thorarchaeota archaeon]|nr:ATP-dependent DNA ligase [Candidatus Thorarchaeota archaeon]